LTSARRVTTLPSSDTWISSLLTPGTSACDGVAFVGFLHVDLDLGRRRQRVAVQRPNVETRRNVLEEVIKQSAACHQ
jgi:hypothetical protein